MVLPRPEDIRAKAEALSVRIVRPLAVMMLMGTTAGSGLKGGGAARQGRAQKGMSWQRFSRQMSLVCDFLMNDVRVSGCQS